MTLRSLPSSLTSCCAAWLRTPCFSVCPDPNPASNNDSTLLPASILCTVEFWTNTKPSAQRTLPSLLATPVEHLILRLPQELFLLQLQNSSSSVRRNTLKIPPSLPLCLGKYLALHISASLGVSVKSVDQ